MVSAGLIFFGLTIKVSSRSKRF